MYELININLLAILKSLPLQLGHVDEYDYLMQNRYLVGDLGYQKRYCTYWRLFGAGLSADFRREYFTILQEHLNNNNTNLEQVLRKLYIKPVNAKGHRKIQFSFSSKLIHMVDPHSPIYDSMVASFFSFNAKAKTTEEKISELLEFHQFLVAEYQRVLKLDLLTPSIQQFRQLFSPIKFTDEKVIDSLIWAFLQWQREDHEHDKRGPRDPRDLAREDKEVRKEQTDAQGIAKEYHMIDLPHGGGGKFDARELVKHIRESGYDYIVQGQQNSSFASHTKPYSLDYWLRRFAKNPDTKQAVNSVCDALVATGLFKTSNKPDPVTGRWVKALCLV